MSEIIIIAINVNVAFQTMLVTSTTSCMLTTPSNKAINAPKQADIPIDNPLGCQMTKSKVIKNIIMAFTIKLTLLSPSNLYTMLKSIKKIRG